MRYDINQKKPLHEAYKELNILYREIDVSEIKVDIESIVRHVIWFYSKDNTAHLNYPKYEERFLMSLKINNISEKNLQNEIFRKSENEIAHRFLIMQADTAYEVWLSTKRRLSFLCKQLRVEETDVKWNDLKSSTDVITNVLELSPKVEDLEKRIFGDHENIQRFSVQKDIIGKAETYVQ